MTKRFVNDGLNGRSPSANFSPTWFGAPVWLWRDPDCPDAGQVAVQSAEEAKAALHGPTLGAAAYDANGQPTPGWLGTFAAIAHAKFYKAPDMVETARRRFRELASAAGALVRIHAVIRRRRHASAADRLNGAEAGGETPPGSRGSAAAPVGQGRKRHRVEINGDQFWAATGEVLLDAALRHGIEIPHDCRTGACGACRVRVTEGQLSDGQCGTVHACQARVTSDVVVAADGLPAVVTTTGRVVAVQDLAPDVVQVRVTPSSPVAMRPGQYLNVRFGGLPKRALSPTLGLEDPGSSGFIDFHVRRTGDGRLSAALGRDIKVGHRVKLTGPFGGAYLRPGGTSRLVLAAGETGFASIWAIAAVALQEKPDRELLVLVWSGSDSFYMEAALRWLAAYPNVTIICAGQGSLPGFTVHPGGPAGYLDLTADDVVHVAGPLEFVDAVVQEAERAGALCHAEPFAATADEHHAPVPPLRTFLRRGAWRGGARRRSAREAVAGGSRRDGSGQPATRLGPTAAVLACLAAAVAAMLQWHADELSLTAGAAPSAASASLAGTGNQAPPQVRPGDDQGRGWALRTEPSDTHPADGAHLTTDSITRAPEVVASAETPVQAKPAIAGVWATHASGCSPRENHRGLLPAVISPEGAWAGETMCAFRKRNESERGWNVVAKCSNPREQWTSKVSLTLEGDRLVWTSRRGTQTYLRCSPNVRFADAEPHTRH